MNLQNKNLQLHPIDSAHVPPHIQEEFLKRSGYYVSAPTPVEEMNLYTIAHENGDTSYLGEHFKTYLNGQTESNTHVIDVDSNQSIIGLAEIRFAKGSNDEYFKDKPFVGWTETLEGLTGIGLGKRRLQTMNAASLALHGHLLHSDTLHSHPAVPVIWEKLVKDGQATSYEEMGKSSGNSSKRYRFTR